MIGTRIRPNHLTTLRLLSGTGGLRSASPSGLATPPLIWGGGLWLASAFLDRADGELARLGKLMSSRRPSATTTTPTPWSTRLFFAAIGLGLAA